MKIFYYKKSKIKKHNYDNNHEIIYIKSLKEIEENSLAYIYKLSDLGNTTFQILKNIFTLFNKNINIHIYNENYNLKYNDSNLPINFLKEIFAIEESIINIRLDKTKTTLKNKTKRAGRKSGKKTKSIFDKHKKIIFQELKKNTPKTEILRILKSNHDLAVNTTPQALGQYIKRQQRIKEKNKKVEIIGDLIEEEGLFIHKKRLFRVLCQ
ncbi:hypothetical protein [Aliarcobacter butzleri]|uniref:hypothetical protein n=1 Tax=Aliarcobacter butzleri TaxID=28197 RepID=UPI00191931C8|nr:hypothetical protein [Aliarcobacter butzleri]MDN5099063.1 hypothetical protein [Aliarcobacter butzleri]